VNVQEKRRLYIVVATIAIAVLLLFLFRGRSGSTIVNQGDYTSPANVGNNYDFGDMPALNYGGAKVGSRGCAVCYDGYSRIVPPAPAKATPTIEQVTNYLVVQASAPAPRYGGGFAASLTSNPTSPRPMCPGIAGRWWPC
jgi:hypothetical protein